jgi:hypothetical protein
VCIYAKSSQRLPAEPGGTLTEPREQRAADRQQRRLAHVPWIIVGLILAPAVVRTTADPDLWGHVRFGLDMLATHTLPRVDPYSFTQDVPWFNHEWLSELIMGAAYQAAGSVGLVVLKGTLIAAFVALMLGAYAGASPLVAGPAFFLVAWGTASITGTLRPQLWTLIGVALLCRLLMTTPRPWWLVGLPLLFAAWVNLHGGWIVGAGLLVVWTSVQFIRPQAPRPLVAAVAILSALATLINPYGWQMWQFLGDTVRLSRDITEWQPLLTLPVLDWIPWLLVVLVAGFCAISKARPPLDRLAMIALLAYASLRVARIAPLCVVACVLLLRPSVMAWAGTNRHTFDPLSRAAARGLVVALLGLALVAGTAVTRVIRCIPIAGDWSADVAAGQALADADASGTIVTWFDWGEYALWHLGPALRVSMDGRRETIYSEAVLADHSALYEGTPEGTAYLERLHPDYVWMPASKTRLRDWLGTHGYRLDVETPQSFVAVRTDRSMVYLRDVPGARCFPGPSKAPEHQNRVARTWFGPREDTVAAGAAAR